MKTGRIAWIDTVRALAMIFIVLIHTNPHRPIVDYLAVFSTPLFFTVSGMVTSKKILGWTVWEYFVDRVKRILVPFYVLGGLVYLTWLAGLRSPAFADVDPIIPVLGMLYGYGHDNWMAHTPALWYFVCLFSTQMVFFLILKTGKLAPWLTILSAIGGLTYNILIDGVLPWYLDAAFIMVGFYGMGYFGKDLINKLPTRWVTGGLILIGLGASYFVMQNIFGEMRVDVRRHRFDNGYWIFLTATTHMLFWLQVGKLLPTWRFMQRIGECTLVIFPFHGRLLVLFALIYIKMTPEGIQGTTPIWLSLVLTGVSIWLLVSITPFFEKYAPWSLGRFKRKEEALAPESQPV